MTDPTAPGPADVTHRPERARFELIVQGMTCHADYRRAGDVLVVHHTEVPPPLEGRGLAAVLVRAVFDFAAAQSLRVQPRCSYVSAWARRHPEVAPLLA